MNGEYFEDRVYKRYYDEVGRHPIISSKEERKLLRRYHTCPHCKCQLPSKIQVNNCPSCGAVAPIVKKSKVSSRVNTCTSCMKKFDMFVPPAFCPRCGSDRDLEARELLIVSNLRFVVRRAKRFTTKLEHLRKLISAGNVGLMLAIDRFNVARNTRFLTYAEWWIRKEMLDEIHASSLIHVPTHRQKTLLKELQSGKYVCIHCGVRTTNKSDVENLPRCSEPEHEFYIPLNNEAAVLQGALSVDDLSLGTTDNVETTAIDDETELLLRNMLCTMGLGQRDLFIMMGYFNVPKADRKSEPKTLPQLSRLTGITPERVRQIKEDNLALLKKELKKGDITELSAIC